MSSSSSPVNSEFALEWIGSTTDDSFPEEFIELARRGHIVGLMRFTSVGVGCPWYSKLKDYLNMNENWCHIPLYPTIAALTRNTFEEERTLVNELYHPSPDPFSDIYAAFQSPSEIGQTKKVSEGNIRRAHVMTCLVDRLMWVSNSAVGAVIPSPIQFPHHLFPNLREPQFEKYCTFMETWPRVVQTYKEALAQYPLDAFTEGISGDDTLLSFLKTIKHSGKTRISHVVIENFTRCALAIRALTHVLYFRSSSVSISYLHIIADNQQFQ
jgi:hypothetical protein